MLSGFWPSVSIDCLKMGGAGFVPDERELFELRHNVVECTLDLLQPEASGLIARFSEVLQESFAKRIARHILTRECIRISKKLRDEVHVLNGG